MNCHCKDRLVGVTLISTGLLLSGCAMIPQEKVPKADLSDFKTFARQEQKCIVVNRNLEVFAAGFNHEQVNKYWGSFDDRVMKATARRIPHIGIIEERPLQQLRENDLSVRVDCRYKQDTTGAIFTGLTLMILPFPCYHSWQYDFTVRDGTGRAAQYHYEDGWREHIGPLMLFFAPFYDVDYESVADKVLGNIYNQLFVSMKRDGFFDPAVRPSEESVVKPFGDGEEAVAGRLKELKSLKDAGVISEEDYNLEVERLRKAKAK